MVGIVALGALAACGSASSDNAGTTESGAPISVGFTADWQTMDHQVNPPNIMFWETGGYDRLTAIHEGEIVPYLAKSWEVAEDNRSATFELRQDAKCQDGTPLTPKVVADSFGRLFSVPKKGLNMTTSFGSGPWSVSADEDNWKITISTETPFQGLVRGVASGEAGIVCPAGLKNPEVLQTGFFGSGPYTLESARHADSVVLKKNPDWTWGPVVDGKQVTAADLPDQQTWKIIPDPTAMANSLQTGEVDMGRLAGPEVKRFDGNDNFAVNRVLVNFPLVMNFQFGAEHSTNNPALRKALSNAVNSESFANAYSTEGGEIELVTSFIDKDADCFDNKTEDLYPSGGIDEAKKILEEAGYTGIGSRLVDPDGKPVTIRIVTTANLHGQTGSFLLEAFKPLGADVKLSNLDTASAQKLSFSGQQEVGVSVGASTIPDPSASIIGYWTGAPVSEGGLNTYGPSPAQDATWNKLINDGFASSSCEPWIEAQRHALDQAIMLPIAQAYWNRVTKTSIDVASSYYFYEPWAIRNAG